MSDVGAARSQSRHHLGRLLPVHLGTRDLLWPFNPKNYQKAVQPSIMTGTRRSTRQSASTIPKYADSDSSSAQEAPKTRKGSQSTRRKRARVEDEEQQLDGDEQESVTM